MRRVRQNLSALFGSMGRPAVSTFASWGCAALAYHAHPLATRGGYAGAVTAAFVLCLPVLFLALWLGAGTLAFIVDAKRSCLPGSQRLARRAKLLASVLLLPALVLLVAALARSPVWRAWGPTVLVVVLMLALSLAALLSVANWRLAEWLRTIRIRIGQRGKLERAPWRALSQHGSWVRQSPVRIIRTCLGGIFVQVSARQLILGGVLLTLLMGTAIALPWLGATGWRWAVSISALVAAGLVSSGFLTQISKLTREQIVELALIPGLGAPAAQRRALYSAVLSPPLLWLAVVLLLGSAALLFKGEPISSIDVLAACIFIMWLTYAVFALQKLANFPLRRASYISDFMRLYVGVYLYGAYDWIYAAHPQIGLLFWIWITPVLITVGFASMIGYSVRRLATAPHPFLDRTN